MPPPPPPPAHLLWVLVGGRWGGETKGARARRSRDLNPVGHGTGTWPAPFHTQTDSQHKEEWRHTQHTRHAAMDSPKRLILARDFYEPYLQSDPLSAESITLIWLNLNFSRIFHWIRQIYDGIHLLFKVDENFICIFPILFFIWKLRR